MIYTSNMSKKTYIKVSGSWEEVVNVWRKVSGVWQEEVMPWIKVSGTWKQCMVYDSVSLSTNSLRYSESGGNQSVTVTSSGTWTSSIESDSDSIINSVTASGGDGDTCVIDVKTNGDAGTKGATVRITVGSEYEDISICQDGTMEDCGS